MNDARSTRTEWVLTSEAFERFLFCLDPDAAHAGEKYESIRRKLVKIFDWRGAHFPEECADETINRIVRKLESGETIRDIPTYCHGIARLVFLETLKKPDNRQVSLDELSSVATPPFQEEDSAQQECFAQCLSELPIESRQLILQYYEDDRRDKINNRQAMADHLGIPLNALRSRAQRIRDKLEQCITNCLGKPLSPGSKK
ncbi:MAG: sigma-70 family RNA polymerase sigma factor [Pyrinomonadaceae bacterium]|nr:sigma-70 family RNA polymerase sigma factor [Pyrinomonadaceae bacterium]